MRWHLSRCGILNFILLASLRCGTASTYRFLYILVICHIYFYIFYAPVRRHIYVKSIIIIIIRTYKYDLVFKIIILAFIITIYTIRPSPRSDEKSDRVVLLVYHPPRLPHNPPFVSRCRLSRTLPNPEFDFAFP